MFSEMLAAKCVFNVFDYSTVSVISLSLVAMRGKEQVELRSSIPRVLPMC